MSCRSFEASMMTYEMAMLMNWLLVASGLLASDLFSDLFTSSSNDASDDDVDVEPIRELTLLGLGDNTFVGTDADDSVLGQGGNDTISGEGGADDIEGNTGDDFISGGSGNDILAGGSDTDTIFGGDGDDILSSDRLDEDADWSRGEDEILQGGAGDDQLYFSDGDEAIGGIGADTFGMIFSDEGSAQISDFNPEEDNVVLYVDDLSEETSPIISYFTDEDAGNTTVSLDGTPTLVFDGVFTPEQLAVTLADTDSIDFSTAP
jgi:Ca2+-binding RTX toxin-like protein